MSLTRTLQLHRQGHDFDVALEESVLWKGSSKVKTEQNTNQTSTPAQTDQYNNLLGKSDEWLNNGGLGGYYPHDTVADMNVQQNNGLTETWHNSANLNGIYANQATDALGNYFKAYNPQDTGVLEAIDAGNKQLDYNYDTVVAPRVRQGATDAGQYGSTRHGVAEGIAETGLAQAKAQQAQQLAYQDRQQYNQNQLGLLNNLSNITTGINSGAQGLYNVGSAWQQQQQNEINGDLERWAYDNNVDLNSLIAYKNLISGDMGGTSTGTSTGTQKGGGGGGGFMGMLGQVGGQFAGSAASSYGSKFGGSF